MVIEVMSVKREISVSVDSLHSISQNIKKLAISVDGVPTSDKPIMIKPPPPIVPPASQPVVKVLSTAKDDFHEKYQIISEIGRGGFSKVYKCKDKISEDIYAVKIIDLRPLRLRERFNPARIRREVDIMRRLRNPNIIQFVDAFENPNELMLVMEYAPGDELFDVILQRKFLSETDARPIFAQVCRALFYLHSLNIIHRDVKPENVLILHALDANGIPIAKLLDFGLSKNAGAGSAAKTFVGTPCYLAPEVEYTSKGIGGTYGLPADCWSLGAVLYVMLVARFPEFEQDNTGKVVVRLPPALWDDVSSEAKDLIRSLMNTNPAARATVGAALLHPWLGRWRATPQELSSVSLSCYEFGIGLQEEEEEYIATTTGGYKVSEGSGKSDPAFDEERELLQSSMVVVKTAYPNSSASIGVASATSSGMSDQFPLAPLLHLQRGIATCFEEAHRSYQDLPEVATKIRRGAALCREQLTGSTKMLRQIEQTAAAVLNIFPDLELAVQESEPQLAADFFNIVRGWVTELRELVLSTQRLNKASMDQIQQIVEESTMELKQKEDMNLRVVKLSERMLDIIDARRETRATAPPRPPTGLIANGAENEASTLADIDTTSTAARAAGLAPVGGDVEDVDALTQEQVLELFMSMFGKHRQKMHTEVTDTEEDDDEATNNNYNALNRRPHRLDSPDSHGSIDSFTGGGFDIDETVRQTSEELLNSNINSSAYRDAGDSPHRRSGSLGSLDSFVLSGMDIEPDKRTVSNKIDRERRSPDSLARKSSDDSHESVHSKTVRSLMEEVDNEHAVSLNKIIEDHSSDKGSSGKGAANLRNASDSAFTPSRTSHRSSSGGIADKAMNIDVSSHPASAVDSADANEKENDDINNDERALALSPHPKMPSPASRLADALRQLRQVDMILEQLSFFWANTEVVLDVLTKKGQHAEQFIGFSSKPRLMARFTERLEEYKRFWEGVSLMCNNYVTGVQQSQSSSSTAAPSSMTTNPSTTPGTAGVRSGSSSMNASGKMYGFLDAENAWSPGTIRSHDSLTPPPAANSRKASTSPTQSRGNGSGSGPSASGLVSGLPRPGTFPDFDGGGGRQL